MYSRIAIPICTCYGKTYRIIRKRHGKGQHQEGDDEQVSDTHYRAVTIQTRVQKQHKQYIVFLNEDNLICETNNIDIKTSVTNLA